MDVEISQQLQDWVELWQDANRKNDPRAQYRLATLYAASSDVEAEKKAFEWYKKSAAQGFTDACFSLGKCYEDGKGTRKNYRQAVRWYKAAQRGVSDDLMEHPAPMERIEDAMVQRSMEYEAYAQSVDEVLEAQGSPWEDSFQRDLEEAENGDAEAQNRLGHRYRYGQGVEPDMEQAVYWFWKSAQQGCEAGISHYATCMEERKEYKEAAKWHRKYAQILIKWRKRRLGW